MKKIGWFKRLFMSWGDLERYFNSNVDSPQTIAVVEELYKKRIEELEENNKRLNVSQKQLEDIKIKLEENIRHKDINISDEKGKVTELQKRLDEIRVRLSERDRESEMLKSDIHSQLKTIGKIEKTFFASTGNKGKGQLGEKQVQQILEKMGFEKEMWIQNLTVGSNTVEFAMKSGEEGKYIPIDSKVLDPEFDTDGKAIVNDAFKNKVKSSAREVSKYLSKTNTAEYGILVLQSDELYMALFNEYPTFFEEIITDYKIHIQSPSSFVQTAWSLWNIIKIYKAVHNDEMIYEDIVGVLDTIQTFGNNLYKTHKTFNIAMKNFNTIQNKHIKLVKRLDKEGKIKEIPRIENKEANDEETG